MTQMLSLDNCATCGHHLTPTYSQNIQIKVAPKSSFYAAMSIPTTLRSAINSNDIQSIRAELAAHPNIGSEQLNTCLVLAMPQGHMEVIKLLLQLGAQLDHESSRSIIEREDPAVLQLLVESGWDMNTTEFGRTAVQSVG
jgi:hypothetical protein